MSGALKIRGFYLQPTEVEPAVWPSRLPSGLNLLPSLLSAARSTRSNPDALLDLIRLDVSLAAGVLAVARHMYGSKLRTLKAAVAHLGERELFRVAAGVTCTLWFSQIERKRPGALQLWHHALLCAVAAHAVADHAGLDPELAYTAGLLHDVGKVLLWTEFANDYLRMMAHFQWVDGDLCAAERKMFGLDHATIGARLLRQWKYPRSISSAVHYHHRFQAAKSDPSTSGLCRTLQVANALAHTLRPQVAALKELSGSSHTNDDSLPPLKNVVVEQFSREFAALKAVSMQAPDRN